MKLDLLRKYFQRILYDKLYWIYKIKQISVHSTVKVGTRNGILRNGASIARGRFVSDFGIFVSDCGIKYGID
jgi:hypothetical protein